MDLDPRIRICAKDALGSVKVASIYFFAAYAQSSRDDDYTWDWDHERAKAVTLVYNLLQLNLNTLFDPPLMEEEVVNLIGTIHQSFIF